MTTETFEKKEEQCEVCGGTGEVTVLENEVPAGKIPCPLCCSVDEEESEDQSEEG